MPPHRVYQPGKRHMELIASVSRSSGLEKDGDALRDFKVQEEYRDFIQSKVDNYWKRYPICHVHHDVQAKEVQQNLLILFRKLREGIMSTSRSDPFALEAYETSLGLAIIFRTPAQTSSALSHLLPNLYLRTSPSSLPPNAQITTVLALLHYLVAGFPSQSQYRECLNSLPPAFLPRTSGAYRWVHELARTLRRHEYARLDVLTRRSEFEQFVGGGRSSRDEVPGNLALEALCTLVDALRTQARQTTWLILRSAYREVSCLAVVPYPGLETSTTSAWLARSLVLYSIVEDTDGDVDIWLECKATEGEAKRKEGEGMEGRWVLTKLPAK